MVAGSAALAAVAPNATATGGFDAQASAASGTVIVAGQTVQAVQAQANENNGTQSASIPSSAQGLQGLTTELGNAIPGGAASLSGSSLAAVETQASGDDGTSEACAAVLASNCQAQNATPLTYKVTLNGLLSSLPGLGGLGLGSLLSDRLVLTIKGPSASCAAGPSGSGLQASTSLANVTAALDGSDGTPVGNPVQLSSGDILTQLSSSIPVLGPIIGLLSSSNSPLTLTIKPGTTQQGNGVASAVAGELGLATGKTTILETTGGKVTCGPNAPIAGSTPPPASPGSPGSPGSPQTSASSPAPTPTPTSGTASKTAKPLSKIQTDEGRSGPVTEGWLALNGTP